jgi:hypothetical protein
LVEADAFEDAVTIEETMVEDGDLGLGLGIELTVDVDFHNGEKPTLAGRVRFFQPESPFSGGYLPGSGGLADRQAEFT